jgi:oligopeptide/dipeptide ABC transporter ATP-binding protein
MEYAPADELFDRPFHPYTHLLLSAAPDATIDETSSRIEIGSELPENLTETIGCNFRKKCPLNEDRCRNTAHEFIRVGKSHWVRCWKAGENGVPTF